MPSLNMNGPYELTEDNIDLGVPTGTIGNYALGVAHQDIFAVKYVGRSDTNLNQRLKDHITEGYTHYMFALASSAVSAYKKECEDYHAFLEYKLDNKIHPDKPKYSTSRVQCPVCGQ